MKLSAFGVLCVALIFLGGCDAPVLDQAARSIRIAGAYDNVQSAARNNDAEKLGGAIEELNDVGAFASFPKLAPPIAETAVRLGTFYEIQAQSDKGAARLEALEKSAVQFRMALRLAPQFDSKNADSLNALGYFLANRGSSSSDFDLAEKLTRRAVALLDAQIAAQPGDNDIEQNKFNRAITRDSLAWALFRQKRFGEALREQQAAIEEAKIVSSISPASAELRFHLGAIFRALGKTEEARNEFQAALKLEPDNENARAALQSLEKVRPKTE